MATITDRPEAVVIALGSNLGNRAYTLRRALDRLKSLVTLVKVSRFLETEPLDAPAGSPPFLNAVAAGHTRVAPAELLAGLLSIEKELGRRRPSPRNAPRTIDLDLIFHGGQRLESEAITLPHPRWRERDFVVIPLIELELPWLAWLKRDVLARRGQLAGRAARRQDACSRRSAF